MEEQVTMQEMLSREAYKYLDIMDNTDITSDEYKEAFRNYAKIMELLLATDKQANENSIAWARHDLEVEKARQKPDEAALKREIKREIATQTINLLGIFVPGIIALIRQRSAQDFGNYQLEKMCFFEENGTLTSYPGKTAYKLVENEIRD